MSYKCNFRKNIRVQKLQNKNHMVGQSFNVLLENERREHPWLGGWQFDPDKKTQLEEYLKEYHKETERLLKLNPNLKLV